MASCVGSGGDGFAAASAKVRRPARATARPPRTTRPPEARPCRPVLEKRNIDEQQINLLAKTAKVQKPYSCRSMYRFTVELSRTKLGRLRLLLLGGIIENQNSDFVMA